MGTVSVVALCKALGLNPEHVRAVTMFATGTPRVDVEFTRRYVVEHPDLADGIEISWR